MKNLVILGAGTSGTMMANETHALVLDTRDAEESHKGFIPNSVNIGLEGNFAQ